MCASQPVTCLAGSGSQTDRQTDSYSVIQLLPLALSFLFLSIPFHAPFSLPVSLSLSPYRSLSFPLLILIIFISHFQTLRELFK